MTVHVPISQLDRILKQTAVTLAAEREREENQEPPEIQSDIIRWNENHFYLPATAKPVRFLPHQKCILRMAFTRRSDRQFPYQTIVISTIKQSGKSTMSGMVGRWMAETQTRYGEIMAIGNDLDQAKGRGFREIRYSIELNPAYVRTRDQLPGVWNCQNALTLRCLSTGTQIKAIAVDAKGEAGGKPALTIWTELWGFEYESARRFWAEMTPVPTVPDSLRLVETYAGYEGESKLLYGLYEIGQNGRQCTAGELARAGATSVPGETYEELLFAFAETNGDPDALVPVWVNEAASLFMYWDSGPAARRMPWQHLFSGDDPQACGVCRQPKADHERNKSPAEYYPAEESDLGPTEFRRMHHNEWVSTESQFVPIESWDRCYDPSVLPLEDGEKTPIILALDAASTHDCFGIIAVSRHHEKHDEVSIRAARKWDPAESGGRVDYDAPEAFVREACKLYNVVQITFDPYQLEHDSQRFRRDAIAWVKPFSQQLDRLRADRQLYDLIVTGRLHHRENPKGARTPLRDHILNANARVEKDQTSKLRIVQKKSQQPIDLAVAMSMGSARCLELLL